MAYKRTRSGICRMLRRPNNFCVVCLLLIITALNVYILYHSSIYKSPSSDVHQTGKEREKTQQIYSLQFDHDFHDDFTDDNRFTMRKERLESVCLVNKTQYNHFMGMCNQKRRTHAMYHTKSSNPRLACYTIQHNAASLLKNILYQSTKVGKQTRKNPYLVEETDFSDLLDSDTHKVSFHEFWNSQDVTRFTFVRDPYARLLSSYLDSVYISNPIQWRLLAKFIRPSGPKSCVTDITFREYVDFYLRLVRERKCPERLMLTNYQEANPCQVNYNFVGKFEHLEKDITYILDQSGLIKNFSFAHFQTDADVTQITKLVKSVFDNWKDIASCGMSMQSAIKRIWRRLQSKGILGIYDVPPEGLRDDNQQTTIQTTVMRAYLMGSTDGRRENRVNALKEAYATLPDSAIAELQQVFQLDFTLFGYRMYPDYIKTARDYVKPMNKFSFFEF